MIIIFTIIITIYTTHLLVFIIMNDCLAMVPFPMLKDSIFCLSAYIHQKTDLNISLSALNLLWNAVDYLGGIINSNSDSDNNSNNANATSNVNPEQVEALVLALFVALKSQCLDNRPEVRKG